MGNELGKWKNKFCIVEALDTNGIANGELYWDNGEELGKLWVCFILHPIIDKVIWGMN